MGMSCKRYAKELCYDTWNNPDVMKEKNPPPDLPDTNRYLWYNNPTDRKIPPEDRSARKEGFDVTISY